MRYILPLIFAFSIVSCTQKTEKTVISNSNKDSLQTENDSLKKVIDTLRRPEVYTADTLAATAANARGKHPITLQWIGWNDPGEATLEPLSDGSYQIAGRQANDQREYLNITGVIKRVSDRELEFDGTVETHVNYNNGGRPCIKTGKQKFLRTGKRIYYRMQDMDNCEGGRVVDYIDIYPGTSGLMR